MCVTLCDVNAMQRNCTTEGSQDKISHASSFKPVFDSRKRKVRGLITRNGKYYAQMRVPLANGKTRAVRIPLKAGRLDDAIAEAEGKRV